MPSILVTGGAGFIGSCFVRQWLAEEPDDVIVLDKLTYAGHRESLREVASDARLHFHEGDIADRELVDALLSAKPWAIVNFAAESHVDRSIDRPADFLMTNVVGACQLLEASLRHWQSLNTDRQDAFRFLHVSTDEVYGSLGAEGRFTESSPYAPNSPYAASKAAADHFVRAYYRTYGLPTLTTNCSNNYGPYQYPEKLIPLMTLNAHDGEPLPIYGDGAQVRDWLHVEDHCRGLRLALQRGRPGEVYNFGGDNERTNREVVEQLCDLVDTLSLGIEHAPCRSLMKRVADRPGHDRRYAVDATKARTELDWKPQLEFSTGLERTVRWYLENRDWCEAVSETAARQRRGRGRSTGDQESAAES